MKQATLPTISIVTPSFNQAQFIKQTIDSVLGQQYPKLQYHVQDGGSTDGTKKILEKYSDQLTFESKTDKGQTDAINKGLAAATGEVFAYINSDDYYLSGALNKVASIFSEHPQVQWVVGDALIVDADSKPIQGYVRFYKRILRSIYTACLLHVLNPLPQPSVFIRRSAIEAAGGFDESLRYTMDYDMWQKLQQKFGNPYIIPDALSAFRIHGSSKGGSQYQKQFAEELSVVKRYTKNPLLLWLHRMHNQCILLAYGLIK